MYGIIYIENKKEVFKMKTKAIKINSDTINTLMDCAEEYFIKEMFEDYATKVAKENNIDIEIAKIIIVISSMNSYDTVLMSKTRIIFVDDKDALVYTKNEWVDWYEDGKHIGYTDISDYLFNEQCVFNNILKYERGALKWR